MKVNICVDLYNSSALKYRNRPDVMGRLCNGKYGKQLDNWNFFRQGIFLGDRSKRSLLMKIVVVERVTKFKQWFLGEHIR